MLWACGPLYRVYRAVGLADSELGLVRRRLIALWAVAWVPLVVLTALAGHAWGGVRLPFLQDFDVQARLLVALPILVAGEPLAHQRVRVIIRQFVDRHIILEPARGFDAAVESATKLSRSALPELLILLFVCTAGVSLGRDWSYAPHNGGTWYSRSAAAAGGLTPAGWWHLLISRSVFQFVLFRWYFKLLVWGRLLWQVSRLDLNLQPAHPDRRAGLGFLSAVSFAFVPFLFAHGTMLAGRISDSVRYEATALAQHQIEFLIVPATALALVLGPELAFVPRLWFAKREGLATYGSLAEQYVRQFQRKWLNRPSSGDADELLGTADIQSLADLGNSFEVVQQMGLTPISRDTFIRLAVVTLLPLAPLPLFVVPTGELIERLVKVVL